MYPKTYIRPHTDISISTKEVSPTEAISYIFNFRKSPCNEEFERENLQIKAYKLTRNQYTQIDW